LSFDAVVAKKRESFEGVELSGLPMKYSDKLCPDLEPLAVSGMFQIILHDGPRRPPGLGVSIFGIVCFSFLDAHKQI